MRPESYKLYIFEEHKVKTIDIVDTLIKHNQYCEHVRHPKGFPFPPYKIYVISTPIPRCAVLCLSMD